MATKISKIVKYIAECEVIAEVTSKSKIGSYSGGQYISLELTDQRGAHIKLTAFGNNVSKLEEVLVSIFDKRSEMNSDIIIIKSMCQ